MKQIYTPIRLIPEYHDSDWDGVPNFRDCNLWNPREHRGVRPSKTMKKRLEKHRILVSDNPPYFYGVTTKAAKKESPKAQKQLFSAIKKYPNIVGVIERTQPREYMYTSKTHKDESSMQGRKSVVIRPPAEQESKERYKKQILKGVPKKYKKEALEIVEETPYTFEDIGTIGRKQRRAIAKSSFHELRHVQQEKEKGRKEMERKGKKSHRSARAHWKLPIEIDARWFAKMEIQKKEDQNQKKENQKI